MPDTVTAARNVGQVCHVVYLYGAGDQAIGRPLVLRRERCPALRIATDEFASVNQLFFVPTQTVSCPEARRFVRRHRGVPAGLESTYADESGERDECGLLDEPAVDHNSRSPTRPQARDYPLLARWRAVPMNAD